MKLATTIFLCSVFAASAQTIETRVLNPKASMKIYLSPNVATTLLLPSVPSGTFGLGLTSAQNPSGSVQLDHPDGSSVLVLRALNESARVTLTVLMDGTLYVFDLQSAPQPDVAVTLVKSDPAAPRATEVTPEEMKAARIKYDPELFVGLERKARDAALLRNKYPILYEGYNVRSADYSSDSGAVKTTVSTIHRFSKEDAIVLEGVVSNETAHPIDFDGRAVTVQVANEVHPAKLTACVHPIPAGAVVPIAVVLQGDIDGARANLSIENEFRIYLPGDTGTVWQFKNGGTPKSSRPFKVPAPSAVPLTQTAPATKEGSQP